MSTISVDTTLTRETAVQRNFRWFCDDTLKNEDLVRMVRMGWKVGQPASADHGKDAVGLYQPIEHHQLGSL